MAGVYTDNQPDFTWLQPYEEKTFVQYFIPYRELGVVKNASEHILMNIEMEEGCACLRVFATSAQASLHIVVTQSERTVLDVVRDITPEKDLAEKVEITSLKEVSVVIFNQKGSVLLEWQPEPEEIKEIPEAAKAALAPEDIQTTEELYLTGLHLEQYRHATYAATDYYREALRRDPGDVRNNNALGLWLLRKGQFAKAEPYLRRAVKTLTAKSPNPYDGEPLYNWGLSLKYQGRFAEAYDCFYKACWNAAWQDVGYYSLAQISVMRKEWESALYEIDKSLMRNWCNLRGRHLKTIVLRHLGQRDKALALIEESLSYDRFNFGCCFEKYLITENKEDLHSLLLQMRGESHNYEELALDYASCGCWEEAIKVVDAAIGYSVSQPTLLHYYKAWFLLQLNKKEEAVAVASVAEQQSPDYCFPNALEAIPALQAVVGLIGKAPKALYYLGNLWYDKRQYAEAVAVWEKSIEQDPEFPTVLRNLSLAYFNKLDRKQEAVALLEKAFYLDVNDARILMELDQLYKRLNRPHAERLALLDTYRDVAFSRDDLYLEYVTLLNQLGCYEEALHLIDARQFHPWEGGEGKVPAQYQLCRVELVKACLKSQEYERALRLIDECFVYPHNLGEGKLQGAQENDFNYYKGCILQAMGRNDEAQAFFRKACVGNNQPAAAMYYNDQKPDKIFYQGLAWLKLGNEEKARGCFNRLVDFGEKHLFDVFKMDYFAVSLPDLQIWEDDMDKKNRIHCNYLMGLGHLGLGHTEKARFYFGVAAALDNNHQGVQVHNKMRFIRHSE